MDGVGSQPAQRRVRVMEFQTKTRPEPAGLLVPGLDQQPAMSELGMHCEAALEALDEAIGWNRPDRKRPNNAAQASRQKARGALGEALLYAFAAMQYKDFDNDR